MAEAPEKIWADCDGVWHSQGYSEIRPCAEYVRADIAERQIAELQSDLERVDRFAKTYLRHKEAAEADKARLSEALEKIEDVDFDGYSLSELHEYVTDIARAALSGSGAGGWRLVPYLWQCKDYADGWLSYANEGEAQAYQRDTGCAVRITYRPRPAAPTGEAS